MITLGPIEKLGTIWWFEFFDLDTNASDYFWRSLQVDGEGGTRAFVFLDTLYMAAATPSYFSV